MKINGRVSSKTKAVRRHREAAGSLEASIAGMAASGVLAKPAQQAISRLRKKGFPITFQRGLSIIKLHADGREEVLGEIKQARLPTVESVSNIAPR